MESHKEHGMEIQITINDPERIAYFTKWFCESYDPLSSYKRDIVLPERPEFKLFGAFPRAYTARDGSATFFTIAYERKEHLEKTLYKGTQTIELTYWIKATDMESAQDIFDDRSRIKIWNIANEHKVIGHSLVRDDGCCKDEECDY